MSGSQAIPLRQRHASLTRSAILDAVTDLLADGALDFTVQGVADRAGVSHRTVYRYFDTREALLHGLVDELEARLARLTRRPTNADEVPAVVCETFAVVNDLGAAIPALIALGLPADRPTEYHERRDDAFLRAFREVTGHLPGPDAEAVGWVLRVLASNRTLARLWKDANIDGRRSGRAVAWALEVLLKALRRGEGPAPEEEVST